MLWTLLQNFSFIALMASEELIFFLNIFRKGVVSISLFLYIFWKLLHPKFCKVSVLGDILQTTFSPL